MDHIGIDGRVKGKRSGVQARRRPTVDRPFGPVERKQHNHVLNETASRWNL